MLIEHPGVDLGADLGDLGGDLLKLLDAGAEVIGLTGGLASQLERLSPAASGDPDPPTCRIHSGDLGRGRYGRRIRQTRARSKKRGPLSDVDRGWGARGPVFPPLRTGASADG